METNTIYAIKHILQSAKKYAKKIDKKRKTQEKLWEHATLVRDIYEVERSLNLNN